jgi:hypothetical protein
VKTQQFSTYEKTGKTIPERIGCGEQPQDGAVLLAIIQE